MTVDRSVLWDGLDRAIGLVEEDEATAVLIVAVHRGGHGVRIWSSGNVDDKDIIQDKLMRLLPLSNKPRKIEEEDDGA